MSRTELQHLIKMMNQISANMALAESDESGELAAAKVADHIKRFWARSMREIIISYAESDGEELQPVSMKAVGLLKASL